LLELVETDDSSTLTQLGTDIDQLEKKLELLEFQKLLGDEMDSNGAIISINAGAGGTESCDWAAMLARMYKRWCDDRGFATEEVDFLAGEEAGIKNVTFTARGPYAFGFLKSESGVHRLVRISPFDSNKRRHTSFASVEIVPEIDDSIQIDINPADVQVDTYRAGGAGGQHVNKTDSAVRLTHAPSGIVVQCQNERSQFKNKERAMKMLKSKLYTIARDARDAKVQQRYSEKQDNSWGSQIRSYVLHPYNLVKDHRTEYETSDAFGVLEGNLDKFMEAYLKMKASEGAKGA